MGGDFWLNYYGGYGICNSSNCTPCSGIIELVEENKNGFLVDSRNARLLHEKLNILLNNQDVYERMAICSLEKIHLFSEGVFVQKKIKILNIDGLV